MSSRLETAAVTSGKLNASRPPVANQPQSKEDIDSTGLYLTSLRLANRVIRQSELIVRLYKHIVSFYLSKCVI